ncbi:hypothetical protein R9C00_29155 [Flammeovirgaceae bacterium SG7u.111]|nr:hypothetical protein [Flammeovirgaceae bacterium SG7u.132]WPO35768.1 hypothetical protein R9C00_29155 [Flammeovirgaceae bacterium SG7u.111]
MRLMNFIQDEEVFPIADDLPEEFYPLIYHDFAWELIILFSLGWILFFIHKSTSFKVQRREIRVFFVINLIFILLGDFTYYTLNGYYSFMEFPRPVLYSTGLTLLFFIIKALSQLNIQFSTRTEFIYGLTILGIGLFIFISNLDYNWDGELRFLLDTHTLKFKAFIALFHYGFFSLYFYPGFYDCGVIFSPDAKWTYLIINIFGSSICLYLLAVLSSKISKRLNS